MINFTQGFSLSIIFLILSSTLVLLEPHLAWAGHDADLNDDGIVNSLDVSLIASCFDQDPQTIPACQLADLNHDRLINILDMSTVASNLGQTGFPKLELGLPASNPDGIQLGDVQDVVFAVKAFGVETLPTSLTLEEVDNEGNVLATHETLTDEGTKGDVHAHDGIYGGTVLIQALDEKPRLFRATVSHQGRTLNSPAYSLTQTRFPIGPAPSDPDQVLPPDPITKQRVLGDEVIVGVSPSLSPGNIQTTVDSAVPGAEVIGSIPSLSIYQIRLPSSGVIAVNQAITTFQAQQPQVRYAEPALIPQLFAFPNDPEYVNSGSTVTQTNMIQIRADEAWLVARGTRSVKIAIVDTGINGTHTDFKTLGISKVMAGYDQISNLARSQGFNSDGMGATKCHKNGHGTRVAGVAAAIGNNAQGIAGVAWDTQLVPVRAVDNCLPSNQLFLIAGIHWGTTMTTAQIINVSAGLAANIPGTDEFNPMLPVFDPGTTGGTSSMLDAILALRDRPGGAALLVAAAGNNNTTVEHYPCAYTNRTEFQGSNAMILCVGATTNSDRRLQGVEPSNFGSWVNIWAPADGVNTTTVGGGYDVAFLSRGTSMAAPLVAGAAAVLWSQHPSWTAQQIHERLLSTATSVSLDSTAGTGHRLDLFEAVFNGSFELGDGMVPEEGPAELNSIGVPSGNRISGIPFPEIEEWQIHPNIAYCASANTSLVGALSPPASISKGSRVAVCRTNNDFVEGGVGIPGFYDTGHLLLRKSISIPSGVDRLPITLKYNFVSERREEANLEFEIQVTGPGTSCSLIHENGTPASNYTSITDFGSIPFNQNPGPSRLDDDSHERGWQTLSKFIPITTPGTYHLNIHLFDDSVSFGLPRKFDTDIFTISDEWLHESLIALDHVQLKSTSSSTMATCGITAFPNPPIGIP
ncbi:MAG: hypothetical protein NPIRA04_10780 [Nitrospirales bacterium]|nr:MAG: hypothetical protein NPIRA04_10780 [Nitrospirales bacterium]